MLNDLPLEVLRRICTKLSPENALSFAHSCRHTYQACDDWVVWRNIVKGSARLRTDPPVAVLRTGRKAKGNNMADAIVLSPEIGACERTVEKYRLQLLVLGYTMAAPLDLHAMYNRCRALVSRQEYPPSLLRSKTDTGQWFEFMTDPTSRFDAKDWLSTQAASLCFVVGALSEAGNSYQAEEPFARLEDVQWFNSTESEQDCAESLAMQHVLANTAIASFCLELRAALKGERTIGEDFDGTSDPPTVSSIPLATQLALHLSTSPEKLGNSALVGPVDSISPEFFTDQTWTGYVSTRGDWRSVYHGIGGHNLRDVSSSKELDAIYSSNIAVDVDHAVSFRVANHLANGDFILQSNFFHTRDDMYTLTMLVERRTGRLSICMSRPGGSSPKSLQTSSRNALSTPFGIVYGIEPGSWLWLWKTEMSAGRSKNP